MFGYIYKTTNRLNGKIYVGKKHKDVFDATYLGSGIILQEAVRKNGIENFDVELLEWCPTLEELNKRERFWIETTNSRNPDIGYNIAPGGDGGIVWKEGHHPSLGVRRCGEDNPFFGKHHSQKSRDAQSASWKKKIDSGYVSPSKGRRMITRDGVRRYVPLEVLSQYIAEGWKCTEHKKKQEKRVASERVRQRASETHKGKVISDAQKEKFRITLANKSEEEKSASRKRRSDSHIGKVWVTDGTQNKMLNPDEVQAYLDKGFYKGKIQRKHKR